MFTKLLDNIDNSRYYSTIAYRIVRGRETREIEVNKMTEATLNEQKIQAEIAKLMAETAKLNKEIRWYEIVAISAATLTVVAIAKLFI